MGCNFKALSYQIEIFVFWFPLLPHSSVLILLPPSTPMFGEIGFMSLLLFIKEWNSPFCLSFFQLWNIITIWQVLKLIKQICQIWFFCFFFVYDICTKKYLMFAFWILSIFSTLVAHVIFSYSNHSDVRTNEIYLNNYISS